MKISQRLTVIVLLTLFEILITIWAALEVSKGATFHRLNFLHLKYQSVFADSTYRVRTGGPIDSAGLRRMVLDVRQQPLDCLATATTVDRFLMRMIGTDVAIELCQKDIADADRALQAIEQFQDDRLSRLGLLAELERASAAFVENSSQFEQPIDETVSFIMKVMIPLLIGIGLINIVSIFYLSRTITRSLRRAVAMLDAPAEETSLSDQIQQTATGELKELLVAAQARIGRDLKIRQTAGYLEAQVQRRTESLSQANDELAQFAYRASHDLKAPLSSSKGLARLIPMDIDAGDLKEAKINAQKITEQMEGLEDLIVNILELARSDLSHTDVGPVLISELVSDIRDRFAEEIAERNIDFQFEDHFGDMLQTSRVRLTQLLENLISNGLKYCATVATGRRLRVRVLPTDKGLEIAVEDNGLGIPNDQHDQVFDRFRRFHPRVASGAGLGLAIVKRHVDRLGGSVVCAPLPVGTRFTITLPLNAAPCAELQAQELSA
ncbi:MAG: ATP-binding protein [Pseudomonadales bacterium]